MISKSSSVTNINLDFSLDELNNYSKKIKPKIQSFWNEENTKILIEARKKKIGVRTIAKMFGKARTTISDKIVRLELSGLL